MKNAKVMKENKKKLIGREALPDNFSSIDEFLIEVSNVIDHFSFHISCIKGNPRLARLISGNEILIGAFHISHVLKIYFFFGHIGL